MSDLALLIDYTDLYESPNDTFGMFEYSDKHIGGVTVPVSNDRYSDIHCIPTQYSIAELSKDYAKQGRENPSKAAFESIRKEAEHYVNGTMLAVKAVIYHKATGLELSEDSICIDFSYEYWPDMEDCANQYAKENFCIKSLIKEARQKQAELIDQLKTNQPE